MPPVEPHILLTCEHGGNRVPAAHRALFRGRAALLASHRGFDRGALAAARRLARALDAPLVAATVTRLLVDLNRSPHNPAVFSEMTRPLARAEREALLRRFHRPHWQRVRAAASAGAGPTLHVAVHSFVPVWRGVPRRCDVGILYDPARSRERSLAIAWQRRLREALPGLRVRRNAPYRGNADGLTTALRRSLPRSRYLGLELELSQAVLADAREAGRVLEAVARTLGAGIQRW